MDNYNEKQARVNALKQLLANSDYKALKAFEGNPSSDWEEVKALRAEWREEVDLLLSEIEDEKAV